MKRLIGWQAQSKKHLDKKSLSERIEAAPNGSVSDLRIFGDGVIKMKVLLGSPARRTIMRPWTSFWFIQVSLVEIPEYLKKINRNEKNKNKTKLNLSGVLCSNKNLPKSGSLSIVFNTEAEFIL